MKDLISKTLAEGEWSEYYFKETRRDSEHLLEASVDPDLWDIELVLDTDFEKKFPSAVKKYIDKHPKSLFNRKETQNIEDIVYSAVHHEIGHWSRCPFDEEFYADILKGTEDGLKKAGFTDADIESYKFNVSNMFMDVIDNVLNSLDGKRKNNYHDGISLFYIKEGVIANQFSDAYTIFVDSQMRLVSRTPEQRDLARGFAKDYDKIKTVVKDCMDIFLDGKYSSISKKVDYEKQVLLELKRKRDKNLFGKINKYVWEEKSAKFSELIAPYLDKMTESIGDSAFSEAYKKDEGFRKRVVARIGGRRGAGGTKKGKDGRGDGKGKKPRKGGSGEGSGKGVGRASGAPLILLKTFHDLDKLYKQRAEDIMMNYPSQKRTSDSRYIVDWTGRSRISDDESFTPDEVDWASTLPIQKDDGIDLWLYRNESPIEETSSSSFSVGGIQDICFIVDSSGSMHWNPKEGLGEYDLLLRSIYSVFNYLEKGKKAYHLNYSAINFSDSTEFSGWHDYYSLDNVKQYLFAYQHGGTSFNSSVLDKLLAASQDSFIAIMVTDGGISNMDSTVASVRRIIRAGNDFSLIQIGGSSSFYSRLNGMKVDVNRISSPADLIGLTLKKARRAYDPSYGGA